MPRPQKYHTTEDRAAANRAKSRRHYEKNKSTISAQRRTRRRIKTLNPKAPSARVKPKENNAERKTLLWSKKVKTLMAKFNALVETPQIFCDKIYDNYKFMRSTDILDDAILEISRLQKHARQYEAEILELAGVTKPLEHAQAATKPINILLSWLEEILSWAMLDGDQLHRLYTNQELLYQS
ncbi:hypothetical protein BD779DRAFT_1680004 [Infundibulicybe gibba]|nr:hypothetical protein BD779DRAFT_1685114 [Infundibulicybe gibba]KAF8869562.1 hypothetical protein BD779DRAFT_1681956 [Infundibulicybe gibba]KAF8871963.1 hypothetical protein BD779DRAFT_1680004 [Infundibulicybe gibba]